MCTFHMCTHDFWMHDRDGSVGIRTPSDGWGGTRRKGPGGKRRQGACKEDQLAPLFNTIIAVACKGTVCSKGRLFDFVNLVL